MKLHGDFTLRVIADGLIYRASCKPKGSRSAELLRDAVATILDADMEEAREREVLVSAANDPKPDLFDRGAA